MTFYVSNPYVNQMRRIFMNYADNAFCEARLPIDVTAENDGYVIQAYVPGLKAEDIDIDIAEDTISIKGEYKIEGKEDKEYLLQERPVGPFSRTFSLPHSLDPDAVDATLEDGVLTLRVKIAESAKPKVIKVNAR